MPSALRDASNKAGPKKGRSRSPAKRRAKPAANTAAAAAATAAAAAHAAPTAGGSKAGAALLAAMAPQHREVSRLLYRDFCQQVRAQEANPPAAFYAYSSALRGCVWSQVRFGSSVQLNRGKCDGFLRDYALLPPVRARHTPPAAV